MGKMSKKRATSVGMMSLFGALILFGAPSGAIGEGRDLEFQEALGGSIIDAPFDLNGDGFTGESFLATGSGVFGTSNINGVVEVEPLSNPVHCESDEIEVRYVGYSIVRRFAKSGDLLFSTLDEGFACLSSDLATGRIDLRAKIAGGTGRFQEATGRYRLTAQLTGRLLGVEENLIHLSVDGQVEGTVTLR
jgi:hypothetical protein